MNAAMGQMLEEFFDYATELQRSLNGPGGVSGCQHIAQR